MITANLVNQAIKRQYLSVERLTYWLYAILDDEGCVR